jgi:hypothetical protein
MGRPQAQPTRGSSPRKVKNKHFISLLVAKLPSEPFPNKKEQSLTVEVALPDGGQFSSEIKVGPAATAASEDQELTLKLVPFPVCLPGDKEGSSGKLESGMGIL